MASIHITQFAGLVPELAGRNMPAVSAQVAHNCLLTNGTLRPQAKWVLLETRPAQYGASINSIAYDRAAGRPIMYASYDAVTLQGAPFAYNLTVGGGFTDSVICNLTGVATPYAKVGIASGGVYGSVSYSRTYMSSKPVNRLYAISRVRKTDTRSEEGVLACLIGLPDAIVYEGDTAYLTISIGTDPGFGEDGATHIRIYRSISGLDTGQEIANSLDTGWYLIDEMPIPPSGEVSYSDGGSVTTDYMDDYFAGQFHAPILEAEFFGLTESGWFVAAAANGDVAASERYLHHAWPVENTYKIPETITDMAVHVDNVFVGTDSFPYIVPLQMGDKALMSKPMPFPEPYRCLPGSMTASPSGAIYAACIGLVGLGREGQVVLTASIANAGDILYSRKYNETDYYGVVTFTSKTIASIDSTNYGAYYNGWYYGFCSPGEVPVAGGE